MTGDLIHYHRMVHQPMQRLRIYAAEQGGE